MSRNKLLSWLLFTRLLGWMFPVEGFILKNSFQRHDLRSRRTAPVTWQDPTVLAALPPITDDDAEQYMKRAAVLASVPVAWGSFEVAVRFAYAATAVPIPPLLFSVGYYAVAVAFLWPSTLFLNKQSISDENDADKKQQLDWTATRGGVELGSYLLAGNLLQVIALQTIPSDRAAFLLQLTTLFVPITQSFIERSLPPKRIWSACLFALMGVALMTLDTDEGLRLQWELGDTLVIFAAVSYTFHCLRLETFAQRTDPLRLAASKALTELLLSCLLAVVSVSSFSQGMSGFFGESGRDCFQFVSLMEGSEGLLSLALASVWTGLIPVSYTIYAQSYGQAKVRPVTANLIYTTQPIWTAVFAYVILGERLEPIGYFGGALIGASVVLAVLKAEKD